MKNLSDILNEGIFDKDLISNSKPLVDAWCNQFLRIYDHDEDTRVDHIDHKEKKIILNTRTNYILINAKSQPFAGFPGYDFIDMRGSKIDKIYFYGDIVNINNIPKSVETLAFYDNAKIHDDVWEGINKQFKILKYLYFLSTDWNNKNCQFDEIDLSKITTPIKTVHIGPTKTGATIKFNPDQKINTLQFGYNSVFQDIGTSKVINLPIIKDLSFKEGNFEEIKNLIENIQDKGKTNFNAISISCKSLNPHEKEALKKLLNGEESEFGGYGDILRKLDSINSVVNDKDGTKDRFGVDLNLGDIVLVADTANAKWPSILDIYKGGTNGGRIKTEKRSMVPPRNIIKLNNPKILELLK